MARLDWELIASQLAGDGFAILRGSPGASRARTWAQELAPDDRKLHHLDDSQLPASLATWRRRLHERLVPIADAWAEALGHSDRFASRARSFIHRLGDSEYQALHSCNEGEDVLPLQLVILLSEPGVDFSGGELVVVERRPRMQSRPVVVPLGLGDAALIPTAKRPVKGSSGYYAVDARHGVSRVRGGERVGLELFFHLAYAPCSA